MAKDFSKKPDGYSFFNPQPEDKALNPDREELKTAAGQTETPAQNETAPAGFYRNPEYIEKKTKRVQLVFKPSTYEKAKACASAKGLSLNEFIHELIENY